MQAKIERWLERLPEHTTSIVLRAGDDRRTETIIERWTPDDLQSIIDETMDLMQDEIQGRLIAYGEKGKQLRSVTIRTEYKQDNLSETEALVDGLLKMADEQRRFLATITDSFTIMHETIQDSILKERDTQEEIADLQVALAMEQLQSANNEPTTADKALGIFSQVLQQKQGNPIQMAKDLVSSNPEIIDALLEDESIIDLVTQKIVGGSSQK